MVFAAVRSRVLSANFSNRLMSSKCGVGNYAADFLQVSTHDAIQFHSWLGNHWGVMLAYPSDFSGVATTELGLLARMHGEFVSRHSKVLALSADSIESHTSWLNDFKDTHNLNHLPFPILADDDLVVSESYDMVDSQSVAEEPVLTSTLLIVDPSKQIRFRATYPSSVGRNVDEILRLLDALQLTDGWSPPVEGGGEEGEGAGGNTTTEPTLQLQTPANWTKGGACLVHPSFPSSEADARFSPEGWREVKPYLRVVSNPPSPKSA